MAGSNITQSSFNYGELSPEFHGASESEFYNKGLSILTNFYVRDIGTIYSKEGTKVLAYNNDTTSFFIREDSAQIINLLDDNIVVLMSGGIDYLIIDEITNNTFAPSLHMRSEGILASLENQQYLKIRDTTYLFCDTGVYSVSYSRQNHALQFEQKRLSNPKDYPLISLFEKEEDMPQIMFSVSVEGNIWQQQNISYKLSIVGNQHTFDGKIFVGDHLLIFVDDIIVPIDTNIAVASSKPVRGTLYCYVSVEKIYNNQTLIVKIDNINLDTNVQNTETLNNLLTQAGTRVSNIFKSWNFTERQLSNNPVTLFDGRLWIANNERNLILGSSVLDPWNFNMLSSVIELDISSGIGAISVMLPDAKRIAWIMGGEKLFIGTDVGVYCSGSSSLNDRSVGQRINQSTLTFTKIANINCSSECKPVAVNDSIFFVSYDRKAVYELALDEVTNSYKVFSISKTAQHILSAGIKQIEYVNTPNTFLACLLDNGNLAIMGHNKGNSIYGWSRFIMGGGENNDAKVLTMCKANGIKGEANDRLYFLVKRGSKGITIEYLDYIYPNEVLGKDLTNAFCVDCGQKQVIEREIIGYHKAKDMEIKLFNPLLDINNKEYQAGTITNPILLVLSQSQNAIRLSSDNSNLSYNKSEQKIIGKQPLNDITTQPICDIFEGYKIQDCDVTIYLEVMAEDALFKLTGSFSDDFLLRLFNKTSLQKGEISVKGILLHLDDFPLITNEVNPEYTDEFKTIISRGLFGLSLPNDWSKADTSAQIFLRFIKNDELQKGKQEFEVLLVRADDGKKLNLTASKGRVNKWFPQVQVKEKIIISKQTSTSRFYIDNGKGQIIVSGRYCYIKYGASNVPADNVYIDEVSHVPALINSKRICDVLVNTDEISSKFKSKLLLSSSNMIQIPDSDDGKITMTHLNQIKLNGYDLIKFLGIFNKNNIIVHAQSQNNNSVVNQILLYNLERNTVTDLKLTLPEGATLEIDIFKVLYRKNNVCTGIYAYKKRNEAAGDKRQIKAFYLSDRRGFITVCDKLITVNNFNPEKAILNHHLASTIIITRGDNTYAYSVFALDEQVYSCLIDITQTHNSNMLQQNSYIKSLYKHKHENQKGENISSILLSEDPNSNKRNIRLFIGMSNGKYSIDNLNVIGIVTIRGMNDEYLKQYAPSKLSLPLSFSIDKISLNMNANEQVLFLSSEGECAVLSIAEATNASWNKGIIGINNHKHYYLLPINNPKIRFLYSADLQVDDKTLMLIDMYILGQMTFEVGTYCDPNIKKRKYIRPENIYKIHRFNRRDIQIHSAHSFDKKNGVGYLLFERFEGDNEKGSRLDKAYTSKQRGRIMFAIERRNIKGLHLYNEEKVHVTTDGKDLGEFRVKDNEVDIKNKGTPYFFEAHIGYGYYKELCTLDLAGGALKGSSVGAKARQTKLMLRLYNSGGGEYCSAQTPLVPELWQFIDYAQTKGSARITYTSSDRVVQGSIMLELLLENDIDTVNERYLHIRSNDALPLNILSITRDTYVSDN